MLCMFICRVRDACETLHMCKADRFPNFPSTTPPPLADVSTDLLVNCLLIVMVGGRDHHHYIRLRIVTELTLHWVTTFG